MDKLVLIDDDWCEVILDKKTNPVFFDSIIEQKVSQVNRIILTDNENWWTIAINSNRVILIN